MLVPGPIGTVPRPQRDSLMGSAGCCSLFGKLHLTTYHEQLKFFAEDQALGPCTVSPDARMKAWRQKLM